MILRTPSYYTDFHCIAGACKSSCCIGWEIDIDDDTLSYYQSVEGDFGKRLRDNIRLGEDENRFILKANGWCPFLNEEKLCDICMELGEEALSEVCTEYPRFTTCYGNVMEKGISISCEELGRILFSNDEKAAFVEREISCDWDAEEDDEDIDVELEEFRKTLEADRDEAIRILQDRELPLRDRVAQYLHFCEKRQHVVEREHEEEEIDLEQDLWDRVAACEELEIVNRTWSDTYKELKTFYREHSWKEAVQEYEASDDYREVWYEQLLVYFTFRYFMESWYDGNLLAKAQFAVASTVMIRDMDVVRYFKNGKHFSLQDRIEVARIYSKEMEHSEENQDILEEDFAFEETFHVVHLIAQMEV